MPPCGELTLHDAWAVPCAEPALSLGRRCPYWSLLAGGRRAREAERGFTGTALTGLVPAGAATGGGASGEEGQQEEGQEGGVDMDAELAAAMAAEAD